MHLAVLDVRNLRVVREARLEPAPGLNVLVGANGSGKTSFLEAAYVLGTARSFRTRRLAELVSRDAEDLRVRGELARVEVGCEAVGVEKTSSGLRIRLGGEEIRSASALARRVPVLAITPETQRVLTDGATLRRGVMDWSLFHVEPGYLAALQRFRRALRQRNAALQSERSAADLAPWDEALAKAGEELHALRERCLTDIFPVFGEVLGGLLDLPVEIRYERGWKGEIDLATALHTALATDMERGFTGVGPHRADLAFRIDKVPARQVLSRGEGKLFVGALLLAQARHLAERRGAPPLLMVDDLASELDMGSRERLFAGLEALGAQTFVTTVSRDLVEGPAWGDARTFHVEHGSAREMV